MSSAVVVGGGPNGLAAALHLARNGVSVTILEAKSTVGGGARSGEAGYPGLINDYCSAVHPLGIGSPFWQAVDLERYGLHWRWPTSIAPIRSTTVAPGCSTSRSTRRLRGWDPTESGGNVSSVTSLSISTISRPICSGR